MIELKAHLIDKCINRHYASRYIKFISLCAKHNETVVFGYSELHHILPKAFWPEYQDFKMYSWNSVRLSARQHVIAHWMLGRALGGAMIDAMWMMANGTRKTKFKLNSRMYAEAKQLKALNPFRHTDESKLKLSIAHKKVIHKPHKDETKVKMSLSAIGKPKSDETRARMSKAALGKPGTRNGANHTDEAKALISAASKARRVVCPHCNKEGHVGAMTRHHLDNCKLKSCLG